MGAPSAIDLRPDPLLAALREFQGRYVDLDRNLVTNAGGLREMRDTIAKALRRSGIEEHQRILFAVGNGPQFVAAFFALLELNTSPLPIHCEAPLAELLRYAHEFGASGILSDNYDSTDLKEIATHADVIEASGAYRLAYGRVDTSHADFQGNFPNLGGVPLHPTSGTTGRPKIAVRHGAAAVAEGEQYARAMEIDADDTILGVAPMTHAYAFGTCMAMPLLRSATVYTTRKFNPRTTAKALAEHPITTFFATPAVLDLVLAARKRDDPVPRRVLSAGAPLLERTARRFFEATGHWPKPLYGTTETGGATVAYGVDEPCVDGNIGPLIPPVEVKICLIEDAEELADGVGRVAIKSPSLMAGYLRPEGIDDSVIEDGWFKTGDVGFIDDRGFLNLAGRESEFINVFGMKVIPSEVEAVIAAFPGVTDVKVYAGKHRTGSEIVKACVAAAAEFDTAALREHCQQQLVHYKCPEVITRLDAVPRSPLGKIIRDQLP